MAFTTTRRLGFGACDPSGIAYFPAYFGLLVEVLEEFFEQIGVPWPELMRDSRIGTPTVTLNATFVRPGFHGDLLDFAVHLKRMGLRSIDFYHEITANGALLWSAEQRIVATSIDGRAACAWPDAVRAGLIPHLENMDA